MEKGNEPQDAGGGGTAVVTGTGGGAAATGGTMVGGGVSTATGSGGGPSTVANPGKPSSMEWDNGDGTRTRKTIRPDGTEVTETLDSRGRVTETLTETPDSQGNTDWEKTDADGDSIDGGRYANDRATTTDADGNHTSRVANENGTSTRRWDKDGKWQSDEYTSPDGAGQSARNADGTTTGTWTGDDGSRGTYEYDSNGVATSREYSNPTTGASQSGSIENGEYTEVWDNADGSGGEFVRDTNGRDYSEYRTWDTDGETNYEYKPRTSGPGGQGGPSS